MGDIARGRASRRLRHDLMRWREEAGLSREDAVAEVVDYGKSASALYQLESGQVKSIRPGEVRALLEGYAATGRAVDLKPQVIAELVQQAREIASAPKGWFEGLLGPDTDPWFRKLLEYEAEARLVRGFYPTSVPGMFQTEDYARAIMESSSIMADPDVIKREVRIRIERGKAVRDRQGDSAPQIVAILWEAALRQLVGGRDVMREQLDALLVIGQRPNVAIQILPFEAGAHPAMSGGPIVAFEFDNPEDLGVIYLESHFVATHMEENTEVIAGKRLLETVRSSALPGSASRDRIAEIAANL